jgi:hypothetical protein
MVLQAVCRMVIVAKLLYTASAWWGFTNLTDQQRVDAFLHHSRRFGLFPPDLPAAVLRRAV